MKLEVFHVKAKYMTGSLDSLTKLVDLTNFELEGCYRLDGKLSAAAVTWLSNIQWAGGKKKKACTVSIKNCCNFTFKTAHTAKDASFDEEGGFYETELMWCNRVKGLPAHDGLGNTDAEDKTDGKDYRPVKLDCIDGLDGPLPVALLAMLLNDRFASQR